MSVIKRFFRSKEEAITDIKNEGFWPFSWLDNPGASFGDKLLLPARTVHRGRTDGGAKYIVSSEGTGSL